MQLSVHSVEICQHATHRKFLENVWSTIWNIQISTHYNGSRETMAFALRSKILFRWQLTGSEAAFIYDQGRRVCLIFVLQLIVKKTTTTTIKQTNKKAYLSNSWSILKQTPACVRSHGRGNSNEETLGHFFHLSCNCLPSTSLTSAADWTHDRRSLSTSVRKALLTASQGQQCGLDRARGCCVSGDELLWSVIPGKTRSQRFILHAVSLQEEVLGYFYFFSSVSKVLTKEPLWKMQEFQSGWVKSQNLYFPYGFHVSRVGWIR